MANPYDDCVGCNIINCELFANPMEKAASKIKRLADATKLVGQWKQQGLQVVFTNGCFDILHLGHEDYLEKPRSLGDKLVLGLNTDDSVSRFKGPSRPIQDENSRAHILAS